MYNNKSKHHQEFFIIFFVFKKKKEKQNRISWTKLKTIFECLKKKIDEWSVFLLFVESSENNRDCYYGYELHNSMVRNYVYIFSILFLHIISFYVFICVFIFIVYIMNHNENPCLRYIHSLHETLYVSPWDIRYIRFICFWTRWINRFRSRMFQTKIETKLVLKMNTSCSFVNIK